MAVHGMYESQASCTFHSYPPEWGQEYEGTENTVQVYRVHPGHQREFWVTLSLA